jgi:hypothetical protein
METAFNLIASSPPAYAVLVIICVALLGLAWFFGIPMYQENKKLRDENAQLQADVADRLREWTLVTEKIDKLLRASDAKTDTDVLQSLSALRLYIEQNTTASNISIESISRAIEELIEVSEKVMDIQRRRDSEYSILFQRYDQDLRAINDKLSQLVGALYAAPSGRAGKRGIN